MNLFGLLNIPVRDKKFLARKGISILFGFILLIVFHLIAKSVERAIRQKDPNEVDEHKNIAVRVLAQMAYYTVLAIGVLLVLRFFGLEIASIIAIVSAVGFAVGLGLQGVLSDIASGVLLTFFKIYDIGDVISIEEIEGKVVDFRLIHTLIEDTNTKSITIVPNRRMQDTVVVNLTRQGYHYFVADFLVSNQNKDFDKIRDAVGLALKDAKRFPDIKQDMPHMVSVADMSKAGTVMRIRVPVTTDGDIAVKRGYIRNALRTVLVEAGVIMVTPTNVVIPT